MSKPRRKPIHSIQPVQPASRPVQPASRPVQPASRPVQPASRPVQPGSRPRRRHRLLRVAGHLLRCVSAVPVQSFLRSGHGAPFPEVAAGGWGREHLHGVDGGGGASSCASVSSSSPELLSTLVVGSSNVACGGGFEGLRFDSSGEAKLIGGGGDFAGFLPFETSDPH
ncbi:hypothetical protein CASFOL_001691 [Castilleja foliolosa]|uniref:Uncharacterized protein n=1 Tax=Castilleja foliolosa TaxID=1961234 RepID=A0ABD3EC92_9LAMI